MAEPTKIFVIDDDALERELLPFATRGSRRAPNFVFARNVEEVNALLPRAGADLILCDNRFPPFDDYRELVPIIRELGYEGPIVVYSASISNPYFEDYLNHDVSAVIAKEALDGAELDRLLTRLGATDETPV